MLFHLFNADGTEVAQKQPKQRAVDKAVVIVRDSHNARPYALKDRLGCLEGEVLSTIEEVRAHVIAACERRSVRT